MRLVTPYKRKENLIVMICRVVKRYTKEEIEVKNKKGEKVKKKLPYYVLVCELGSDKKLSLPIQPAFKESYEYAKLEMISEKE